MTPHDPFDGPEIATTIAACMSLVGVIFTGVMASRANRNAAKANRNAEATRNQVENDHDTNLRDDNDAKHSEQKALLVANLNLSRTNAARLRDVQADVGLLKEGWHANRTDIDENRSRIERLESARHSRARTLKESERYHAEHAADDDA